MMVDPLHQFQIKKIISISLGSMDLSFTNSALFMLITTSLLIGGLLWCLRNRSVVPGRLQLIAELMYEFVDCLIEDNIGSQGKKYFPLVFSLFCFILIGNLLGMVPYSFTFTSHISATFTLAMVVFLVVIFVGLVKHGFHFFTLFFPKGAPIFMAPILVPIELISFFSRPFSLSIRLFANMVAGHIMLKVFAGFTVLLGVFGFLPLSINILLTPFEILVAVLQAYVFTVLTCIYLSDAVNLH